MNKKKDRQTNSTRKKKDNQDIQWKDKQAKRKKEHLEEGWKEYEKKEREIRLKSKNMPEYP